MNEPEFMTADELAKYLRVPLTTIYKLIKDRKIPAFKVGRQWRFRHTAVMKWIDAQEQALAPDNTD